MRLISFFTFLFFSYSGISLELPKHIIESIAGKNPEVKVRMLDSISFEYWSSDFSMGRKILNLAIDISKKNDLKKASVKLYTSFSKAYRNEGKLDSAILYLDSAKILAFKEKYNIKYANIFDLEGLIYTKAANYDKAATAFYKCIEYAEQNSDSVKLHDAFNHIGTMNFYRGDFKNAIFFYNKSLNYLRNDSESKGYVLTLDNIALCYANLNNIDSALIVQKNVVKIAEKINDSIFLAECYINLASTLVLNKKFDEAEIFLFKGLKIHLSINNEYGVLISNKELGKLFSVINQPLKSIEYMKDALIIAEKLQQPNQIKEIKYALANAYKTLGDYKNASTYYEGVIQLMATIFETENSKAINELSAKYESEKQQQQIQLLQKDKLLQDEAIKQEKSIKIFIGVVATLLSVLSILLFLGFSQKKKDNKLLYEKNVAIEGQKNQIDLQRELLHLRNTEITDSINYAKRIQASVLPSENYFKKIFPESFIYFKPKDIVSGDFYWVNKTGDYIYVVLSDCTGHGVPGAMMAMLGASLLNQIILDNKNSSPSEILKQLHLHIVKTLNKNTIEQESIDGMDIAIVRIDTKEKELVFSGGGRPLYLYNDSGFMEVKSNKFAVGNFYEQNSIVCEDTAIKFEKKSIQIYLFSDGITDQFGGEKGKKFMSKQLQSLIIETAKDSIHVQEKKFINAFESWKGDYAQIDDISLLSIKLF